MLKKLLALLMCLLMIMGTIAGCSDGGGETASPTSTPEASDPTPSDDDPAAPELPDDPYAVYPLCDPGEIELEFYYPLFTIILSYMEDMNSNPIIQEMEKLSGVHINWIHPNQTTEAETYNLLFVGDDLPDMVKELMTTYPGGLDAAIADGYYIDINPYAEFYPNYYHTLHSNEDYLRNATTDEGHTRGFGYLYDANARVIYGLGFRKDIFDNLGIETPELVSDWDAAFSTLKDAGYSNFMQLVSYGVDQNWTPAYDTFNAFMNQAGTVVYGPATEGYKEYLKQMQEWYAKGYIYQDITYDGGDSTDLYYPYIAGETLVGAQNDSTWGSTFYNQSSVSDPNFYLAAAHYPRQTEDQVTHNWSKTSFFMHSTYITTECQNIEVACRWLDYWYTEQGLMYCQYGVEGISYYRDEDGHPWLTDNIVNNPDGIGVIWMLFMNTFMGGIGIESTAPRFDLMPTVIEETDYLTDGNYGEGDDDWNMPSSVFKTSEEGARYSMIYADIETYVSEYTTACILGQKDVDATWDNYISTMERMGLSEATAINQASLDRYFARELN